MTIPTAPVAVPDRVRDLARGAALECVWENELGGLTFRADDGRYIKWGPRNAETSMRGEAGRMRWAGSLLLVPTVLEQGEDDAHEWLVTAAIDGLSAVHPTWIARPETAVRAVGEGLRRMHDTLPADRCPWDWGVDSRIANAAERGIDVPDGLRAAPPVDRLVVCHADACVPNTLLDADGRALAHVDLGALGVADRWADIAVASMSTEWNYGPGFEDLLIEAYGVEPDHERLAFYRDLWNAT